MNKNEIMQRAKTLMESHKNPLKKLELSGTKLFLPAGSTAEKELVNNSLDSLAKALGSERAERRCARSTAQWSPEQNLAEVIKGGGILNNFGFANKSGRFLYPEEAMFLLETNRLELLWNNVPLSIQQAYGIILSDDHNLSKYLAYRNLALQGFKLLQSEHLLKHDNSEEPLAKKPRLSTNEQALDAETHTMAKGIFNKMKQNRPKKFEGSVNQTSDYKILSENSSSDFNLHISRSKQVDPSVGFMGDKAVLGYSTSEFTGFFQFGRVDLPDL